MARAWRAALQPALPPLQPFQSLAQIDADRIAIGLFRLDLRALPEGRVQRQMGQIDQIPVEYPVVIPAVGVGQQLAAGEAIEGE
jgi:hypothetical protein